MPLNDVGTNIPRAPALPDPTALPGEIYFAMIVVFLLLIFALVAAYLIVRVWGYPILQSASSRLSGDAIVQHFENSKNGDLKLARLGGGAIRHKKVADGTLIVIPKGVSNFDGHSFTNSWNLTGISLPTFLIGAITKLRQAGVMTRAQLEYIAPKDNENRFVNLIADAYNFNDFKDILHKSKEPEYINLEIEYVNDFIESLNQHYTESEITMELMSYFMKIADGFAGAIMFTAIAVFIVAIAMYILMGAV